MKIVILFIVSFLGQVTPLLAERPESNNPKSFITQRGGFGFTPNGTALVPTSVLILIKEGDTSAVQRLILEQNLMNQCADKALGLAPSQRNSFLEAKRKWEEALCVLERCYESGTLLNLLAMAGEMQELGQSSTGNIFRQQANATLDTLNRKQCGAGAQSAQLDPALQQAIRNIK